MATTPLAWLPGRATICRRAMVACSASRPRQRGTAPPDGDRGPVVGFVLAPTDQPAGVVYVSGDTVWYDGIAEVSRRFTPVVAMLFMGAARVREVGPANLTLTAAEAVAAARAFPEALVVPLHFEGWAHFSESRTEVDRAFAAAGLADRLRWPIAGHAMELSGT